MAAKTKRGYKDPTADEALANVEKGRETYVAAFTANGLTVHFTKAEARQLSRYFIVSRDRDQLVGTVLRSE